MSGRTAKRIVQLFGVSHLVFGVGLAVLAIHLVISKSVRNGWVLSPWLIGGSVYSMWLGIRGWRSPSPTVVRQICSTIFIVVGLPFVVLIEALAWPHDSIVVAVPALIIVFGSFWLMLFGSRLFCRSLFAVDF